MPGNKITKSYPWKKSQEAKLQILFMEKFQLKDLRCHLIFPTKGFDFKISKFSFLRIWFWNIKFSYLRIWGLHFFHSKISDQNCFLFAHLRRILNEGGREEHKTNVWGFLHLRKIWHEGGRMKKMFVFIVVISCYQLLSVVIKSCYHLLSCKYH